MSSKVHGGVVFIFGPAILLLNFLTGIWIKNQTLALKVDLDRLKSAHELAADTVAELHSLDSLKWQDLKMLRNGLSALAKSSKSLYEAGLSLQEEKRVLEKQYKIMTTYLEINEQARKISMKSGEQALEDFPMLYPALTALGAENRPMPSLTQIVSKERFANPERGKSEESNGSLRWNPPQVGTSARSNALGEYVMFTSSALILHGPPRKKAEHDSFPHLCLGLSLRAAQKLYYSSFIGTKIAYQNAKQAQP